MSVFVAGEGDSLLAMIGISKSFGETVALADISFRVRRGTVHALVGENGAGKTTLMRIAFRLVEQDHGTIRIAGVTKPIRSPSDAIAAGLGMVHQHFTNVPAMTVAENVALGGRGRFDAMRAADRVIAASARAGLSLDPNARVSDLPVSAQQRLEIVKALSRDARVLILDEPTAVLAPSEADDLLRWLREFANAGNAVVLITHKLREALAIADDVTVLRRGRVVQSSAASSLTADALAALLVGEEPNSTPEPSAWHRGDVVARIADVQAVDDRGVTVLENANLEVRAGEIVGIAAVEGAGQYQLLRVLADRLRPTRGTRELPATIGFVPEDRHRDALVLEFSLAENLAIRDAGGRRGIMAWRGIRERTVELIRTFDVRGGDRVAHAGQLSGGNQQKLVLARELDGNPSLLVAENPTRGLDIRAAAEVQTRLRSAASAGAAVVVYSSDLDEVLSLATRVVAVHAGRLIDVPVDREIVGRAMLGVA